MMAKIDLVRMSNNPGVEKIMANLELARMFNNPGVERGQECLITDYDGQIRVR